MPFLILATIGRGISNASPDFTACLCCSHIDPLSHLRSFCNASQPLALFYESSLYAGSSCSRFMIPLSKRVM